MTNPNVMTKNELWIEVKDLELEVRSYEDQRRWAVHLIEGKLRRLALGVYSEELDGTLREVLEEIWRALND